MEFEPIQTSLATACGTWLLLRVRKARHVRAIGNRIGVFAVALAVSGCTLSAEKIEFEKAQTAAAASNYKSAVTHYDNVVKRYEKTDLALRSAEESGRISYYELKDFNKAIESYKHLVLYSSVAAARLEAQKKIAEINFEHLQNYEQAIVEYNRLLDLPHEKKEAAVYRLFIAKSYFYMNNFVQALVELESLLERESVSPEQFDVLELKANTLLQMKKLDEAASVLNQLISKFPERAKERQVGLVLAVVYEEKKDFPKAIETLETIKNVYPSKDFIETRIKNLKERQTYLPGARGFRK